MNDIHVTVSMATQRLSSSADLHLIYRERAPKKTRRARKLRKMAVSGTTKINSGSGQNGENQVQRAFRIRRNDRKLLCYNRCLPGWRYRLGVRTEDSQSSNTGSIPVSATNSLPLSPDICNTYPILAERPRKRRIQVAG